MKKKSTPLVDQHLQSIQGMQEAGTDDFFYTRLKARMQARVEKEQEGPGWSFPLKPVWVIGTLVLLLTINGFMLTQRYKTKVNQSATSSSLQSFAESYDQAISSTY
jgi:hypothetical protein